MSSTETLLMQRAEIAEKFVAEAQSLIRAGKNAAAVNRKLQAARNALTGRVVEPELLDNDMANAPVDRRAEHLDVPVLPRLNGKGEHE